MTPSGMEPATFRLVAQYLNHFATISGPQYIYMHVFLQKYIYKYGYYILQDL
jgi:hypothetical protein